MVLLRLAREQLLAYRRYHADVHAFRLQFRQDRYQIHGRGRALYENVAASRHVGGEIPNHVKAFRRRLYVGVCERRAVGDGEVGARHFQDDDADFRVARRYFGGGEVAGGDVVVVPETERYRLPAREELPHLRREDAEVRPRVRRRLRSGVSRQNVQDARPERAVLILLAPDARGQVHERRERAVSAAERPHAHVGVRVGRDGLPDQADGGGGVARFLNRRLQPPAAWVRHRVEGVPDRAVLYVDRFGEVRRHDDEAVVRDVVRPLDDFRDGAPCAANVAGQLEQLDGQVLRLAGRGVGHFRILRLRRQVLDLQARIGERVFAAVDAERQLVVHAVADVGEAVGYPVAKPVFVENGHGDVHVFLELDEALAVVRNRAVADANELHAEALFERGGERGEVVAVHGEVVRVAVVAHDLIAEAGDFAVHRAGPPALDSLAHDDHRAVVFAVPVLHRLEGGGDLIVVVAVVQRHHVPAVSRPLVFDAVCVVNGAYDAADELVVYARVVVREQDSQPLAHLLGDRRRFHFLRVSRRHGEFAFDGDDFQAVGRAHDVPERRLARGRGDADA